MKLIVACDPNGGIGYKNKLPWSNIQGDLPRFKQLTDGQTIVMGRHTWESLPVKPLKNRTNVVVTKDTIDSVKTIPALTINSLPNINDVWLIGGAMLIESSWHLITEIHLTTTLEEFTCDKFIDLTNLKKFTCWYKNHYPDHVYEIYRLK